MQLNQISFERLKELAVWLSSQANVNESEVQVVFMASGEILLEVSGAHDTDYGLKITGDQISFHTETFIYI